MPGFDGTGPGGMGPMTGGGRGFCSPRGVRATGIAYGANNWRPYGNYQYGFGGYAPQMSAEQELEFLRNQTMVLRDQLGDIKKRIKELEKT